MKGQEFYKLNSSNGMYFFLGNKKMKMKRCKFFIRKILDSVNILMTKTPVEAFFISQTNPDRETSWSTKHEIIFGLDYDMAFASDGRKTKKPKR